MTKKPKKELSEKQRENLKRHGFKPGQSGNPKGRQVEDEVLKARIRQKLPELIDRLETIAYEGKNEASAVKAIETMLSYVLSKATTKHEVDVTVTSFGDFLIETNKRHAEIGKGPAPAQVVEAEYEQIELNPSRH